MHRMDSLDHLHSGDYEKMWDMAEVPGSFDARRTELQEDSNSYQQGEIAISASPSSSSDRDCSTSGDDDTEELMNPTKAVVVQGYFHDQNSIVQSGLGQVRASGTVVPLDNRKISQSNPESPSLQTSADTETLRSLLGSPITQKLSQDDCPFPQLTKAEQRASQRDNTLAFCHSLGSLGIDSNPVLLNNITSAPRTGFTENLTLQDHIGQSELSSPMNHGLHTHSPVIYSSSPSSNTIENPALDLSHNPVSQPRIRGAQRSDYGSPDHSHRESSTSAEPQNAVYAQESGMQYSHQYPMGQNSYHRYSDQNEVSNGEQLFDYYQSETPQPAYPAAQAPYYNEHGTIVGPNITLFQHNADYLNPRLPSYPNGEFQIQSTQQGMMRSESPLRFHSLVDWDARRNTLNNPGHKYSIEDSTIPKDHKSECGYIIKLRRAMRDMSKAEDNPGMRETWDRLSSREEDVESACWEILRVSLKLYRQGGTLQPNGKLGRRPNRPFGAHIEELVKVMEEQKTICKHLLAQPYVFQLVEEPVAAANRVINNRKVNGGKKVTIDVGKETIAKNPDIIRRPNSTRTAPRRQINGHELNQELADIRGLQEPYREETQAPQSNKSSRTKKRKTEEINDPDFMTGTSRVRSKRETTNRSMYPLIVTPGGKGEILTSTSQPQMQRSHAMMQTQADHDPFTIGEDELQPPPLSVPHNVSAWDPNPSNPYTPTQAPRGHFSPAPVPVRNTSQKRKRRGNKN